MRNVWRFFILLSLLLISMGWCTTPRQKPNIVFLLADDMGYGELGVYGQQTVKTPHLDALAAQGKRFTDFYAGCSVCSPSRAVLMTGRHTGHTSIRGNLGVFQNSRWRRVPLRKDEKTLGEMLQQAGYQTAFIGKWHLGIPQDVSTWAANRGFDYAVQEQWGTSKAGEDYDALVHWINGTQASVRYDQEKYDCIDEFRTNFALEYLQKRGPDKPFFLLMSYRTPHAHEFYIRNKTMYAEHGWPDVDRRHAARITLLDWQIKRLLDTLEATGDLKNTVVFYTSDNGPHRERGHDHMLFKSAGGLRGHKRDLYEGGIRVPLIVYWKDQIQPGTVSNHIGAFHDVMPTIAELAGATVPNQTDGISFLPTLLDQSQPTHNHLYWELQIVHKQKQGFKQAVRMGKWKGVRIGNQPQIELYDLDKDLREQHNLASRFPDIVRRIEGIMAEASVQNPHYPFSGDS